MIILRRSLPRSQQGITLLIGLLMLIMLTMMAIGAFKFSNLNSMMASNSQQRMEATRAAEQALETVISDREISNVIPANWDQVQIAINGVNKMVYRRQLTLDINGANANYSVTVTRMPCVSAPPVKNSSLNLSNDDDLACAVGVGQNFGVAGATTTDSLCAEVIREARAVATDPLLQTSAEVVMGFGVRTSTDNLSLVCD